MAKILLVEDDPRIASFVTRGLKAEGHTLDIAGDGQSAMSMMRKAEYPLVILDRMLPDFDGVTICRQMRSEAIPSRVLMLTAKDALGDKIEGLNAGADDYLTKPFAFDELVARVEALLRRAPDIRFDPVLQVADLMLDPTTRQVTRAGRAIELTAKEFGLLRYLMEHPGAVLSRTQILNNNWGYGFDPGSKVVDVYIRYLRTKIDGPDEAPLIHTVRGAGYRLGQ
ncbi:response regulator transcription factor [Paracoccus sp. R12_1]|uniref:response regulator transcription factor n=1 Tax=unclassified Paracoccus (in: a-proteobacteria) TaxID=2688777 RepID=UPI000C0A527B|nr:MULTISPECIES: response regulator transcription factor [unclassified Paracoccus (in: a-proteobacteria)]MBO9455868.1 response regulator transcription factor [Paracoccus sp. R12_2]MBO9488444.1 response regulator transcription factor [Paracoccus sp. R12_1]PHQ70484.1 MAG: DNA-binding response regulator [Paracoccus sp. (in: a-proteobacteria)]